MKLTPLADRVILKMVETEGDHQGRHHPHRQRQGKALRGGGHLRRPRRKCGRQDIVMTVKVGDKVITSQYAGTKVTLEDVEYVVVRQNDILAIVE